jgi:hypothetical protein
LGEYFATTGLGGCFAAVSSTLADALPQWSCSSSLLTPNIFGDGVSLLQVQFLGSLVRVVGLDMSSLPFMLPLLVVVVVAGCGFCRYQPFFSVSLFLVLVLAKSCLAALRFVCKVLSS